MKELKFASILSMKNYFFDQNQVRYELTARSMGKSYNWLFFPGGPQEPIHVIFTRFCRY